MSGAAFVCFFRSCMSLPSTLLVANCTYVCCLGVGIRAPVQACKLPSYSATSFVQNCSVLSLSRRSAHNSGVVHKRDKNPCSAEMRGG